MLVDPDIRAIDVNAPQPVVIVARPSRDDVTFRWEHDSIGRLEGNEGDAGQTYIPPTDVNATMKTTISVIVTDKDGNTATASVTLTLKNLPTPTPEPTATPKIVYVEVTPTPAPPQTAKLTVRSNVSGDMVWIDDKRYGATPLNLDLPFGSHQIRIEKEECEPYETTISLKEDVTVRGVLSCQQPTPTPSPTIQPTKTPKPQATAAPTSTPRRVTSCWENETPGATCKEEKTGMEFVYVPGGCFQMGQTDFTHGK